MMSQMTTTNSTHKIVSCIAPKACLQPFQHTLLSWLHT